MRQFFYHPQPCSEAIFFNTHNPAVRQGSRRLENFALACVACGKKEEQIIVRKKSIVVPPQTARLKKRKTLRKAQTNNPSASRKRCSRSGRPTPTGAQSAHMGSFAQNAPQSQARTLVITMIAMIMILKLDGADGGSNLTTQLINISLCRSHSL